MCVCENGCRAVQPLWVIYCSLLYSASRSVLSLVRAQLVHWDLFHILLWTNRSELRDEEITSCRWCGTIRLIWQRTGTPENTFTHHGWQMSNEDGERTSPFSIVSLCDLNLAEFFKTESQKSCSRYIYINYTLLQYQIRFSIIYLFAYLSHLKTRRNNNRYLYLLKIIIIPQSFEFPLSISWCRVRWRKYDLLYISLITEMRKEARL